MASSDSQQVFYDVRPRLHSDQEYFTDIALQEAQRWIEVVTGKMFRHGNDPRRSLQDGILLCELLAALKPGCIRKVNRLPTPIAGLDNLTVFLNSCRQDFGLQDSQLFDMHDLEDLRLRDSIENEDELQYETMKRLKNVVMTIFWLGKTVRSFFHGPPLDLNAFHNLVEAPVTPLSRSEVSLPSLTGDLSSPRYTPDWQRTRPGQHDPFQRHVAAASPNSSTSPVTVESFRFDKNVHESDEPHQVCVTNTILPGSVGKVQPVKSAVRGPGNSVGKIHPAALRSVVSVDGSDGVCTVPPAVSAVRGPADSISRVQPAAGTSSVDRILLTKSVIEESRCPQGSSAGFKSAYRQLSAPSTNESRQETPTKTKKPEQRAQQDNRSTDDSWEENLSNWKSRRLSQRQSESDSHSSRSSVGPPTLHSPLPPAVSSQPAVVSQDLMFQLPSSTTVDDIDFQQPSHKLEESVLAMFGFSREDYKTSSNELCESASTCLPLQQISSTNQTRVPSSRDERSSKPQSEHGAGSQDIVFDRSDVKARSQYGDESNNKSIISSTVHDTSQNMNQFISKPVEKRSANAIDVITRVSPAMNNETTIWLDRRSSNEHGLDFTIVGGLMFNAPIVVESVKPGGMADARGLKANDVLIAVNNAEVTNHYLESVIAVIDTTLDTQPVTLTIRRHDLHSPDSPPPPLPSAPPPPLPAAPPPIHRKVLLPADVGFTVDEEGWNFIDDDNSTTRRELFNIEEDINSSDVQLDDNHQFVEESRNKTGEQIEISEMTTMSNSVVISKPLSKRTDERVFALISQPKQIIVKGQGNSSSVGSQPSSQLLGGDSEIETFPVSANVTPHPRDLVVIDPAGVDEGVRSDVMDSMSRTEEPLNLSAPRVIIGAQECTQECVVHDTQQNETVLLNNNSLTNERRVNETSQSDIHTSSVYQRQSANLDIRAARADQLYLTSNTPNNESVNGDQSDAISDKEAANNGMPTSRELWLKRAAENTKSPAMQSEKMWNAQRVSIDERASQDMMKTLAYQPKNTDEHQRISFDLEAERKKMEQWALEQEQKRQEKFNLEQEELKLKHELELQKAKQLEEELLRKEEEKMVLEVAKQRDLEELARKREEELQAKLKKFGVEPLTTTEINTSADKLSTSTDSSQSATADNREQCRAPDVKIQMQTVPVIVEHQVPVINIDEQRHLFNSNDLISTDVKFSEIKPEQGHFEIILTDSDDVTSSESGTPGLQRRLQVLPSRDTRSSVSPSLSNTPPRGHSPASSDVIVYGADQWKDSRREVMEASKPRPSGWLWMESQSNDSKHSDETSQASNNVEGKSATGSSIATNAERGRSASNVANSFSTSDSLISGRQPEAVRVGVKTEEERPNSQASSRAVAITHCNTSPTRNENRSTSLLKVGSESSSCVLPPRPTPPQRIDSVKPFEMSRTSRSHEVKMSSTTLLSRDSQQTTKSQYYSESFQYSKSNQSTGGARGQLAQSEHSGQEHGSFPTSYRVPVEDSRFHISNKPTTQSDNVEIPRRQAEPRQIEPAAVDALFTYHHMPSTTATTPTSSLTSRCNPAAKTPQSNSPTSATTLRTHF